MKGSHVTIAADDGAKHLYDWGRQISAQSEKMLRNYKPINFYIPKDKNNIIYPYRSYWRLKCTYVHFFFIFLISSLIIYILYIIRC